MWAYGATTLLGVAVILMGTFAWARYGQTATNGTRPQWSLVATGTLLAVGGAAMWLWATV